MARKVFEVADDQPTFRPEFTLGGEDFDCVPNDDVSAMDVLDGLTGLSTGDGISRMRVMVRLFATFIPDDDGHDAVEARPAEGDQPAVAAQPAVQSSMERFRAVVRRKKVQLTVLNNIAVWILDEYLRFPTPEDQLPPALSSNGSTNGGSSNGAGSSEPQAATSPN